MKVLSIVEKHISEDAFIAAKLLEAKKKKAQDKQDDSSSVEDSPSNRKHTIHYDSKFNRNIAKLSKNSSTADLAKIDKALDQLKSTGKVEAIGGVHSINQPIFSDKEQKKIAGWRVIPISRKNEIRLAFKVHSDGVIEVKFGRASDIGYTH